MNNQDDAKEKNPRSQQIAARKKLAAERHKPLKRVRVLPANEEMRKYLRHPNGVRFLPSGSVEWPLDRFTYRRIKDKSVTVEERAEKPDDSRAHRAPPPPRPPAS